MRTAGFSRTVCARGGAGTVRRRLTRVTFAAVGLSVALLLAAAPTWADGLSVDPFTYFNVYSRSDIGRSSSHYRSDFQGIAGAAGDVYFRNFSLHDVGPATPYSLHTGGDAYLTGAYNNGGIEAGGDVVISGASIDGSISSGGDVSNPRGRGGTVSGDVNAAGTVHLDRRVTVSGTSQSGVPYNPTINHTLISDFFLNNSQFVGSQTDTTAAGSRWGQLLFTLDPGINVANVTSAQLDSAWGVRITGPSDATLLINVTDTDVSFNSLVWNYQGGIDSSNVLLNLPDATSFQFTGWHEVNILAPLAATTFQNGTLVGQLVAGNLQGGGQVNLGGFTGNLPTTDVPEVSTIALLISGIVTAAVARRRQKRQAQA